MKLLTQPDIFVNCQKSIDFFLIVGLSMYKNLSCSGYKSLVHHKIMSKVGSVVYQIAYKCLYFSYLEKHLGPIYTTTNLLRIAIYPGTFKFILVKISPDSECLHGRHAKENQTLVTFFTIGIYSVSSVYTSV